MLGTVDEIRRDEGDIDPSGLARVVLAAVLMALGVGAGMWLTASGDRPIADTSIVNVPRPHPDRHPPAPRSPNVAPAQQVPSAAPPAAPIHAPAVPVAPPGRATPHPVEIPAPVGPATGPVDAPVELAAPPGTADQPSD
ncbi:hypothetical protein [Nocardia aurantiaca]|uniref:Uncharacterized protein n=1 Tax=Nocardia aurantiaca TaxID=2675850 RepID=A0A6I3L3P3_9NOCA|nr:hypothetical protein [Nocardia aurantiaca]MTE15918.1 hypothetical protein [Nocardia aurantiaca]